MRVALPAVRGNIECADQIGIENAPNMRSREVEARKRQKTPRPSPREWIFLSFNGLHKPIMTLAGRLCRSLRQTGNPRNVGKTLIERKDATYTVRFHHSQVQTVPRR